MSKEVKLEKKLSPINLWSIAFGCIIGWGCFVNPGKKFLFNSGAAGTAIAMFAGALVMIIISFSYSYMTKKIPKAGGEFIFAKRSLGNVAAFICGWLLIAAYLSNVPMNSTALGLIVEGLFGPILKWGFHYTVAGFDLYLGEILFAIFILLIFYLLNVFNVKKAGTIQTILAIALVSSVVILTLGAIFSPYTDINNLFPLWGFDKSSAVDAYNSGQYQSIDIFAHSGFSGIAGAILATFAITPWAYIGFETIPQSVEEFNFSTKKVITIMIVAILFGACVYSLNNAIAAIALKNWPELIIDPSNTPWLLLTSAEYLLGWPGKVILGIAVFSAVLTGIMGFLMASSRLILAMSRENFLPKSFSDVHPKYKTPHKALTFCFLISLVGPILGREALGWFVDMSSIGASFGFAIACLSCAKTMRKEGDGTKFMYAMSIMGFIFGCIFVILLLIPISGLEFVHFGAESYILFFVWIIIGLVLYLSERKYIKNK